MMFFGHVGITAGVIQALNVLKKKQVDLRKAMVLAVGPDLIDKPLGLLYPDEFGNNTRLYAHSLLFALGVIALFYALRRRVVYPFLLWACWLGHLVLDRMWHFNPEMLFWPFLGEQPPYYLGIFKRWGIAFLSPYSLTGEFAGLAILLHLFLRYKLFKKRNFLSFVRTGLLSDQMR